MDPHGTAQDPAAAARLALRIRAGDRAAEAEMVERYSRSVRFLLGKLTGDPAQADDLHQEAFHVALKKVRAGELRQPEKLPWFILQIARNLFIGEARKTARHPLVGIDEVLPPEDPVLSQLAQLLCDEYARVVRELLLEFKPTRDREVLVRFYLRGEAKERICDDLSLTHQQFNVVAYRARLRFRSLLERAGGKRRPSMEAQRSDPAAVLLERLLGRDGLTFDEAVERIRTELPDPPSRERLEEIAARLPRRVGRRRVGDEELSLIAVDGQAEAQIEAREQAGPAARVREALRGLLRELPADDLLLLRLHFLDGLTMAEIAPLFGSPQRLLYGRRDRCLSVLRQGLEEAGCGGFFDIKNDDPTLWP